MADNTALGRLRTVHTVTAKGNSNGTSGYLSVTNPESIRVGSSMSVDGVNQVNHTAHYGGGVYGLYYTVRNKNVTVSGTTYDVSLNYTISNSFLAVGDTVYFDYDTYGLKVAKKNANVNTVGPKDLIFDSRIRRRGTLYSQGFASSMGTSGVDFKGNKTELAYIPLVLIDEDKKGSIDQEDGGFGAGETYTYDYSGYRSNFQVTKSTIKPIGEFSWMYDDFAGYTFGRGTSPNNSVANCSFKVLRIPCAYGYMTDTYFENPQTTTDTSRGLVGGGREIKDKKRLLAGKLTNSNLGYSNLRGMFISRAGTDIDTCSPDDILMTVDDGKANTAFRGEEQASAVNYSTAVANTQVVPTASISQSINTAVANTFSISVFNPYVASIAPTATAPTTAGGQSQSTGGGGGGSGALSINTSLSTSGFTDTITYTLSATTGTFNLSSNIRQAILTPGIF